MISQNKLFSFPSDVEWTVTNSSLLTCITLNSAFKHISLIHYNAHKQRINKQKQRKLKKLEKLYINEALPGVMGIRGIKQFISGEQGNTSLKMKVTGEPM